MSALAIAVLNGSGHLTLEWDHGNDEETASIRVEVERLREAGYTFFLTEEVPADAVSAGRGKLLVRRMADPVTEMHEIASQESEPEVRRRGRGGKTEAVAVRPVRGG